MSGRGGFAGDDGQGQRRKGTTYHCETWPQSAANRARVGETSRFPRLKRPLVRPLPTEWEFREGGGCPNSSVPSERVTRRLSYANVNDHAISFCPLSPPAPLHLHGHRHGQ